MKGKLHYFELAVGIFAIGAGIFILGSGILWVSGSHILWGIIIIGIGVWRIVAYQEQKTEEKGNG